MNIPTEIITIIVQAIATGATIFLGVVAVWNIREYRKEREMKLIEKKLDEFYFPLIYLLTPWTGVLGYPTNKRLLEINRVIKEKRYLAEPKTLEVLPTNFEGLQTLGTTSFLLSKESYNEWKKALDVLWEDTQNLIKRYYELAGIKKYKLPKKSEWAIEPSKGAEIY